MVRSHPGRHRTPFTFMGLLVTMLLCLACSASQVQPTTPISEERAIHGATMARVIVHADGSTEEVVYTNDVNTPNI